MAEIRAISDTREGSRLDRPRVSRSDWQSVPSSGSVFDPFDAYASKGFGSSSLILPAIMRARLDTSKFFGKRNLLAVPLSSLEDGLAVARNL